MRKVVLFIATSIDGYIADHNGKLDWIGGDGSDSDHPGKYDEFISTVDDVILGYSTYYQIVTELDTEHWTYEGKTSYVLTHRKDNDIDKGKYVHKDSKNVEEIKFLDTDLYDLIQNLQKKDGKNIWICGGASIIKQAMEKDLIDEFELEIMPTLVGSGIPLFTEQLNMSKLQLVTCDSYNGIVHVKYVRR